MEAFLDAAGQQRKGNWNPDYSRMGLWSYIREGFGVDTINWRPVTGIVLEECALLLCTGESRILEASVVPGVASQQEIFLELERRVDRDGE